jgi:hypothetical protein
MDFGEVIGFGVPLRPGFWIGPRTTGEGFRETHIAFVAPDRAAVRAFFQAVSALMPECSMNHACGPSTTKAITAPSCVTPKATTSKPFAAPPIATVGAPVASSRCRRPCGSSRYEWSLSAAGCSNVAKVMDDLAE